MNMRGHQLVNDQKKSGNHSLKLQIMNNYFINQQKQFDQTFIDDIFKLAPDDSQMESIIQQNALKVLSSSQQIANLFMLKLLSTGKFRPIALNFLKDVIYLHITVHNRPFQLFIIENLLQTLEMNEFSSQETLNSALVYLALKIRSFDLAIRLTAIKSLKKIAQELGQKSVYAQNIFKQVIPQMIEKQKIAKEVSYTKGLFLHALQDQFSEMRMYCIKILMLFRKYFKPYDLKTIIIYMLNDQHQIVREQALVATKSLVDQPFNKEDLQTILMCLKQKRSNMRKLVYQTLSYAQFYQPSLLMILIQKVFSTLLIYKADKKIIYHMLFSIGKKYQKIVQSMIDKLGVKDDQEPNWKNITYKGKMILCYHWWSNLQSTSDLPNHFSRHILYIKDIETYLFTQKCDMDVEYQALELDNMSKNQLLRFVQCEEKLSQDFYKTLLNVLHQAITGYKDQRQYQRLQELQLQYELSQEEISIKNMVLQLQQKKQQNGRMENIIFVIKRCLESREKYERNDQHIKKNRCFISKTEPNCVVSSLSTKFQQAIYIKCLKHHLISSNPKIEYKRLKECAKIKKDENFVYWSLKLSRYSRVQCIMKMSDGSQRTMDIYQMDYRG